MSLSQFGSLFSQNNVFTSPDHAAAAGTTTTTSQSSRWDFWGFTMLEWSRLLANIRERLDAPNESQEIDELTATSSSRLFDVSLETFPEWEDSKGGSSSQRSERIVMVSEFASTLAKRLERNLNRIERLRHLREESERSERYHRHRRHRAGVSAFVGRRATTTTPSRIFTTTPPSENSQLEDSNLTTPSSSPSPPTKTVVPPPLVIEPMDPLLGAGHKTTSVTPTTASPHDYHYFGSSSYSCIQLVVQRFEEARLTLDSKTTKNCINSPAASTITSATTHDDEHDQDGNHCSNSDNNDTQDITDEEHNNTDNASSGSTAVVMVDDECQKQDVKQTKPSVNTQNTAADTLDGLVAHDDRQIVRSSLHEQATVDISTDSNDEEVDHECQDKNMERTLASSNAQQGADMPPESKDDVVHDEYRDKGVQSTTSSAQNSTDAPISTKGLVVADYESSLSTVDVQNTCHPPIGSKDVLGGAAAAACQHEGIERSTSSINSQNNIADMPIDSNHDVVADDQSQNEGMERTTCSVTVQHNPVDSKDRGGVDDELRKEWMKRTASNLTSKTEVTDETMSQGTGEWILKQQQQQQQQQQQKEQELTEDLPTKHSTSLLPQQEVNVTKENASAATTANDHDEKASKNRKAVNISNPGIMVYVTFTKQVIDQDEVSVKFLINRAAKRVLNLPIFSLDSNDTNEVNMSVLQLAQQEQPMSIAIVPQVHLTRDGQWDKKRQESFYWTFVNRIQELVLENQCHFQGVPLPGWYHEHRINSGMDIIRASFLSSTTSGLDAKPATSSTTKINNYDLSIPADQIFKDPSLYSSWDERGIPLADSQGEPLAALVRSRLRAVHAIHVCRYTQLLQESKEKREEEVEQGKINVDSDENIGDKSHYQRQREQWSKFMDLFLDSSNFIHVVPATFDTQYGVQLQCDTGPCCHIMQI